MLFKAFVFLCIVASAIAATDLSLGSTLRGSLISGDAQYTFTYDHTSTDSYQFVYVVPDVATDNPQVQIAKQGATFKTNVDCSAEASSSGGKAKCSFSFQGCVTTTKPELYTLTVSPPTGATANLNFTVGAVSVNAVLRASANSLPNLPACCGFKGAAWHYVKAEDTEVVNSISLTVTNGALTSSGSLTSGLGILPPGIFIIPDSHLCTDFNLFNLITDLSNYVKASVNFASNLSASSSSQTVTLELSSSLKLPGVSYWVLVVPNEDSSGEFTLSADMSGGSDASTLTSPLSALF